METNFIVHLLSMTKLIFLLLTFPTFVIGQNPTTTALGGPKNIYSDALKRYIILTSEREQPIFDTIFVQQDNALTDSLMPSISGRKIIIVDSLEFANRFK